MTSPTGTIPHGYCNCGCGQKTPMADRDRNGIAKGQPLRYIRHHHLRCKLQIAEFPRFEEIPYGYCQCGCGQTTRVSPVTHARRGVEAGKPMRYVVGHKRLQPNRYAFVIFEGRECVLIHLKGKRGGTALIDHDDLPKVCRLSWSMAFYPTGSFRRRAGRTRPGSITLHSLIVQYPDGVEVDHKNRNTRDNRKSNLRPANLCQQQSNKGLMATNTSGYKGACWKNNGWESSIKANHINIYLGRFRTREDAARAYDRAAIELHGEFAVLNFPD